MEVNKSKELTNERRRRMMRSRLRGEGGALASGGPRFLPDLTQACMQRISTTFYSPLSHAALVAAWSRGSMQVRETQVKTYGCNNATLYKPLKGTTRNSKHFPKMPTSPKICTGE